MKEQVKPTKTMSTTQTNSQNQTADPKDLKSRLVYRPILPEDRQQIVDIVDKTWDYRPYGYDERFCKRFSRADLLGCLSSADYSRAAFLDGKPMGYILARIGKGKRRNTGLKLALALQLLTIRTAEYGYLVEDYLKLYAKTDHALLTATGKDYGGELVFFAVDPQARGMGVGKELLHGVYNYFRENGVDTFYVFTDTTCDFSFYEKNGFVKMGQHTAPAAMRNGEEITFYIFERSLLKL